MADEAEAKSSDRISDWHYLASSGQSVGPVTVYQLAGKAFHKQSQLKAQLMTGSKNKFP